MKTQIENAVATLQALARGRKLQAVLARHREAADRLDHIVRTVLENSEHARHARASNRPAG